MSTAKPRRTSSSARPSATRIATPLGSALLLAAVALFAPAHLSAQGQTAPPPLGGGTTFPQGSQAQPRGTARPQPNGSIMTVPEDFSTLTLESGFLLDMQVYDMPEISSQLRVDPAGDINVPLAGKLHVGGMTLPEAQHAIVQKLTDAQILQNPEINLDVLQYAAKNVTVLGEVQNPGRVQLLAPHNLPDILAMVGGETQVAGESIEIRRTADGKENVQKIKYARSGNSDEIKNIMVQPGDTVVVPRAGIVYVLGGVNRPGGYLMQEDGALNVAQALSLAYGAANNAATGSMRVIRKAPDGTLKTIPISYKNITKGKEIPLTLQAEDIVYVPVSKFKSIMTAGVASSTSSALIYTAH